VICTPDERPSIFIREKPIFSSERILLRTYHKALFEKKKSLVVGLKGLDIKTN
jgi:hypothetical protein